MLCLSHCVKGTIYLNIEMVHFLTARWPQFRTPSSGQKMNCFPVELMSYGTVWSSTSQKVKYYHLKNVFIDNFYDKKKKTVRMCGRTCSR